MTIRKVVIGLGLALMAFGYGRLLERTPKSVPARPAVPRVPPVIPGSIRLRANADVLLLGLRLRRLGLIIAVIAFTMIAKQERLDLHGELKAVPRTWAKRNYVAASVGLDDPLDVLTPPLVSAPRT